jgi:hypothetical protein
MTGSTAVSVGAVFGLFKAEVERDGGKSLRAGIAQPIERIGQIGVIGHSRVGEALSFRARENVDTHGTVKAGHPRHGSGARRRVWGKPWKVTDHAFG